MRAVKADARQALDDGLIGVRQQALAVGHTREQGQIGFGHTEGQVGAFWRAPPADLRAVLQHDAADAAARVHWPKKAVVGGGVLVVDAPTIGLGRGIAGPVDLMGQGVIDGVLQGIQRACPPSTAKV